MLRENCKIGMEVIFGRGRGEKTRGIVRKINLKKAKVEILEDRGSRSPKGAEWGVPYSMMEPVEPVAPPEPGPLELIAARMADMPIDRLMGAESDICQILLDSDIVRLDKPNNCYTLV